MGKPLCARGCRNGAAWDRETGTWHLDCSRCTGMYRHRLPSGTACLHLGHTAGLMAPAYTTSHGKHIGWVCTGAGIEQCGEFYYPDGSKEFWSLTFDLWIERFDADGDVVVLYALAFVDHDDAVAHARRHDESGAEFFVRARYAQGPLVGQTAYETRV